MVAITEHEQGQINAANASHKTPVVFVHGLWLLPSSWDRWRTVFEEAGYSTLAPGFDHTVPWAIANASYNRQKRNEGVTEIAKVAGRGHALTIDSGWRDVADLSLAFIRRFVQP